MERQKINKGTLIYAIVFCLFMIIMSVFVAIISWPKDVNELTDVTKIDLLNFEETKEDFYLPANSYKIINKFHEITQTNSINVNGTRINNVQTLCRFNIEVTDVTGASYIIVLNTIDSSKNILDGKAVKIFGKMHIVTDENVLMHREKSIDNSDSVLNIGFTEVDYIHVNGDYSMSISFLLVSLIFTVILLRIIKVNFLSSKPNNHITIEY